MNSLETQAEVEAIAKAVGFALSGWGNLESILCSLYAAALRVPLYTSGRDAFYAIISFQGKIKSADAVFKREFAAHPDLITEWAAFKKRALSVNTRRNELAHGAIRIINTQRPLIGWFPFWNGSQLETDMFWDGQHIVMSDESKITRYSSADVNKIRLTFDSVANQGNELYQRVCASLQADNKPWNLGRAAM